MHSTCKITMLSIAWIFLALVPLSSRAAPFPAAHRSPTKFFASEVRHGWMNKRQDLVLTETRTVTTLETSTDVVTEFITLSATLSVPPSLAPVSPYVHFVGDAPAVADAESILFLPDVSVQVGISISTPGSSTSTSAPAPQSSSTTSLSLQSSTATATSTATTSTDSLSASDSLASPTVTATDEAPATDSPSPSPSPDDADPSSSSTDAPPAIAATPPPLKGPIIAAYYPDWVSDTLPPESIDFSRLDWVDFAFGIPDAKFNIAWDDPSSSPALLSRLVKAAHAKNTKVKLSLGGWGGGQ